MPADPTGIFTPMHSHLARFHPISLWPFVKQRVEAPAQCEAFNQCGEKGSDVRITAGVHKHFAAKLQAASHATFSVLCNMTADHMISAVRGKAVNRGGRLGVEVDGVLLQKRNVSHCIRHTAL